MTFYEYGEDARLLYKTVHKVEVRPTPPIQRHSDALIPEPLQARAELQSH